MADDYKTFKKKFILKSLKEWRIMKIYIVGSVASGKTTLGKNLSNKTGIQCTNLDGVVHIKDKSNKEWGNIRRSDKEIDLLFKSILLKPQWIIEDAGRKMFREGMEEADIIIHLKPSLVIRKLRIITRYIKQKLGIEKSIYTPSLSMIKFMFKALNNYETGKDDLEARLKNYSSKVLMLKNRSDIRRFIYTSSKEYI